MILPQPFQRKEDDLAIAGPMGRYVRRIIDPAGNGTHCPPRFLDKQPFLRRLRALSHMRPTCHPHLLAVLAVMIPLMVSTTIRAQIDDNTNGLSDVWETAHPAGLTPTPFQRGTRPAHSDG
mgnify:CR=1 FL=1